jgi:hypothetical protein
MAQPAVNRMVHGGLSTRGKVKVCPFPLHQLVAALTRGARAAVRGGSRTAVSLYWPRLCSPVICVTSRTAPRAALVAIAA